MRLAAQAESVWSDRARCLGTAAKVMRNVLIDHARVHRAEKRGGGAIQVTLDDALLPSAESLVDVLAIDEALNQLERFDAREAEILELHFFGGLTFDEIASHLGISLRTVKRDWTMARAWLKKELTSKQ
jgi:RNA polymerase sigma factor (TIGR02999 family)